MEKKFWDTLAKKNGRHIALTNQQEWSDEDFIKRGQHDIQQYVIPFLQEQKLTEGQCKSMRALDIGCGPGRLTRALSTVFGKAIGIDISSEMISQAEQLNPGIEFRTSESDSIPFTDGYFGFVFSFLVFQHFNSKSYTLRSFKEVYRILQPGGYALIQLRGVPGRRRLPFTWFSFDRLWFGLAKTKGIPLPTIGYAGAFNSYYGPAFKCPELEKELREIGFKSVRVAWEPGSTRRIWAYLQK